jgi:enterochelin esterase-like enzyme
LFNTGLYLNLMVKSKETSIIEERHIIHSLHLHRDVIADFYLPVDIGDPSSMSLLLINDGQDMERMGFRQILDKLYHDKAIKPVVFAAIHAGKDRKMEYGTANLPDYKGRGGKAGQYSSFVFSELLPFIRNNYQLHSFSDKAFAGFSLGGLMALDIVWAHPQEFNRVGVFSGSLWWRKVGLEDGYIEETDRIMHMRVREGNYAPWLKFFFQTGVLDETMDRNKNGIIDSIDDTMGLIDELVKKGYDREKDIVYLEYEDGRHDVQTWGRAMSVFLKWCYSLPQAM